MDLRAVLLILVGVGAIIALCLLFPPRSLDPTLHFDHATGYDHALHERRVRLASIQRGTVAPRRAPSRLMWSAPEPHDCTGRDFVIEIAFAKQLVLDALARAGVPNERALHVALVELGAERLRDNGHPLGRVAGFVAMVFDGRSAETIASERLAAGPAA